MVVPHATASLKGKLGWREFYEGGRLSLPLTNQLITISLLKKASCREQFEKSSQIFT